ncbi:hypothetical protein OE88DRAFT_1729583 [Heliocybe sulcata]|uniref:Uncharacterized protein n=1 Tax=Heliocybe sulcata TaxID=5364 RepID=A0A5C3MK48_9AGAM|nr:hypothetical protein OE88DRAFT_1729583 [Heliocybe sulcata]
MSGSPWQRGMLRNSSDQMFLSLYLADKMVLGLVEAEVAPASGFQHDALLVTPHGQPTRVIGSTPTYYPATGAACKTSIGGSRLLAEADCICEQTARDRGVVCRFGGARARTVKMSPQAQAGPGFRALLQSFNDTQNSREREPSLPSGQQRRLS